MTVFDLLKFAEKELPSSDYCLDEIYWILSSVIGVDKSWVILNSSVKIKGHQIDKFKEIIFRRGKGEPTAYILKGVSFYNADFYLNPSVLIPRPETEFLVEQALECIEISSSLNILDIGTGSGCIGLSMAKERINCLISVIDISSAAIDVAKKNAEKLGVSSKINFIIGDYKLIDFNNMDMIISNPPYIANNSREIDENVYAYEPHLALFGGEKGSEFILSWGEKAFKELKSGGILFFEMGYDQGKVIKDHFLNKIGFHEVKIIQDYSKLDRIIYARKG